MRKCSQNLTQFLDERLDIKINPYFTTAYVFGAIGFIGEICDVYCTSRHVRNNLNKPWIYTVCVMRGFMLGFAAITGAYFGSEITEGLQVDELQVDEMIFESL